MKNHRHDRVIITCKLSSVPAPRGFFENADPVVTDPIPNVAADLKA